MTDAKQIEFLVFKYARVNDVAFASLFGHRFYSRVGGKQKLFGYIWIREEGIGGA